MVILRDFNENVYLWGCQITSYHIHVNFGIFLPSCPRIITLLDLNTKVDIGQVNVPEKIYTSNFLNKVYNIILVRR